MSPERVVSAVREVLRRQGARLVEVEPELETVPIQPLGQPSQAVEPLFPAFTKRGEERIGRDAVEDRLTPDAGHAEFVIGGEHFV